MSDQEADYRPRELMTGEYWVVAHKPTPAEKLYTMRARVLALKAELERGAIPRMSVADIVKRLGEIAE